MKTATLLLLGTTPAAAIGYFLLTGYLLNRVKPLPIANMPWPEASDEGNQTAAAGA